jgi:hypothetical protein
MCDIYPPATVSTDPNKYEWTCGYVWENNQCQPIHGMEVGQVWQMHDFDYSGCLNFCEFMFVYKCNAEQHEWSTDFNMDQLETLYKAMDGDDDCCLSYNEFDLLIRTFGGIQHPMCDINPEECYISDEKCHSSLVDTHKSLFLDYNYHE